MTEEKSERKEPAKKGLHGWKAAVTVFGCGTLAAFGVFGVIVGVLSLIFNVASSGVPSSEEASVNSPAEQIGAARSDLGEGEMDVCTDNLTPLSTISVNRQDDGGNYLDTSDHGKIPLDNVQRLVKDQCHWEIIPRGNSAPWDFYFSYEAIIDADEGESREGVASVRFEEKKSNIPSELDQVESEIISPFGNDSYSAYGSGGQGGSSYIALVQVRSAVYQIRFDERPGQSVNNVTENAYSGEARRIVSFLKNGFEYWIPE